MLDFFCMRVFSFLETLPKNMWCRFDICFLKVFWPRDSTIFCNYPAVVLGVFSHSNSPSHRALGRYRHTSSSRQFRNIFCWLEILNYCPDGGNCNVHNHHGVLKIVFWDILLIILFRGINNCVQCVFEKKKLLFHTEISPHFNCFSSMKGWILVFFFFLRSKWLIMLVYFHSLFWSYFFQG